MYCKTYLINDAHERVFISNPSLLQLYNSNVSPRSRVHSTINRKTAKKRNTIEKSIEKRKNSWWV